MRRHSLFSTAVTTFVSLLVVTSFVFAITTISTDVTTDGIVTVSSGSASAPSYSFVGDTNTGIFRDQADVLSFTAGGTRTMSIINGSVGIGTTSPATALDVRGGIMGQRVMTAKTSNYTVTAAESNSVFTNTGASGTVTFTLPTPAAGLTYTFMRFAAQNVVVDTPASTQILQLTNATGDSITSDTNNESISLMGISATQWMPTGCFVAGIGATMPNSCQGTAANEGWVDSN